MMYTYLSSPTYATGHPYYSLISDLPNHIWWAVNCMKQLSVLFSQPSSYFLQHTFRCFPQYCSETHWASRRVWDTALHTAPNLCMSLHYRSRNTYLKVKGWMETWSRLQKHSNVSSWGQGQKDVATLITHLLQKKKQTTSKECTHNCVMPKTIVCTK